jgi:hypothetical protein
MRRWVAGLGAVLAACGGGEEPANHSAASDTPPWEPGVVYPSSDALERGLLDRRGLIHAHSVYSHDACDNEPRDPVTGELDLACLADFRFGMCKTRHDFVMLTDHDEMFAETSYPDALLYAPDLGDTLLERDSEPVGNWLTCPEEDAAHRALVLAGCEAGTMPVGLDRHVAADAAGRSLVYGAKGPEAIQTLKDNGAVALVAHTEGWSVDELVNLPLDGFEMYNLHANLEGNLGAAVGLITKLSTPEQLPHSDLVLLPVVTEDPVYLEHWGSVLARGARRVTTMATDCHENVFQQPLPDGERVDSYRRMMLWFSNHLLVTPTADGGFDDRSLKDALRAGRLYGAFELLGYPAGFEFTGLDGGEVREMGSELSMSRGAELHVRLPTVRGLDAARQPPRTLRLLRAKDAGWDVIAEGDTDLSVNVDQPGAYRAEVRMVPTHLEPYLSSYADLAQREFVWIYSNAIYVVQ